MKHLIYSIGLGLSMAISVRPSFAQEIIAVTESDMLIRISDVSNPGSASASVAIAGLSAGQTIAGTDFRPNTGELIALGYNSGNGQSQLYIVNPITGAASAINAIPFVLELGTGSIGFDFNPTVDRIRVVGANGKNYRLNPVNGTIAATDMNLNLAASDPNFGVAPSVGACGYTNSYIGTEATTLYVYDESLNVLATQNPPNNGVLNTIGSSGVLVNSANRTTDMDIWFDPISKSNKAYFSANIGSSNQDNLYQINLATGAATSLGMIGSGLEIKDIATVIDRTVPSTIGGQLLWALTRTNGNLISFDSQNPSLIRSLRSVTGLTAGQILVGIDVRPATMKLYGLGYNNQTSEFQLYIIDPSTGVATVVNGTPGILALGAGPVGFDFNPTVDRIRVVSANGNNYRLNPNNGAIAATDLALNYAVGDVNAGRVARVGSVGYTNSFNGATTTTLFGLDDSIATFVSIVPPNNGTLNTLASSILSLNLADLSTDIDFYYDSASTSNMGFLAANMAGENNDKLFSLSTSGVALEVGGIGMGIPVRDLAARLTFVNASVKAAAPTFTPPAGTYAAAQMVTITSTTASSTILYTTNGNTPVAGTTFTKTYTAPILVNDTMVIKAIATRVGFMNSNVASAAYNIQEVGVVRTPVISPNAGSFDGSVMVSISSATPGSEIFYTTNGNLPKLDAPNSYTFLYTSPFTRYNTTTIRAIARKAGLTTSGYAVTNVVVNNPSIVAAPVFNPAPGVFGSSTIISISSTTPGTDIYLSTNGITPSNTTPAARQYAGPFNLSQSITLKAIAYKIGFQPSVVTVGTYTIGAARVAVDALEGMYFEQSNSSSNGEKISLSVYPNPTEGRLTIQTTGLSSNAELRVLNAVGQLVKTEWIDKDAAESMVDVSALPSGMYSLTIQSDEIRKNFKITKQ